MNKLLPFVLLTCTTATTLADSLVHPRYERIKALREKINVNYDQGEFSPFTTDGCSMYPDQNYFPGQEHKWIHCCIAHDIAYWIGGTADQREVADTELKNCVTQATNKYHGKMMYLGVKVGGVPGTGLPWAWGYGWQNFKKYSPLSEQNIEEIRQNTSNVMEIIEVLPSKLVCAGLSIDEKIYIQSILKYKLNELSISN